MKNSPKKDELFSYKNGNVFVKIYEDGSLERSCEEDIIRLEHPTSMDVKITNFCNPTKDNPICAYCHESSNLNGKHGDLTNLLQVIKDLPAGVELAIGGGAPLSHPDIIPFLIELKNRGIIANLTVNQKHLNQDKDLLLYLVENKLIYGLGVSYSDSKYLEDVVPIISKTTNVVFHIIMGLNNTSDIDKLYDFCALHNRQCKVLILGYKEFGYGLNFYLRNKEIEKNKYSWYTKIPMYFKKNNLVLSFDNLAIKQLKLKRFFTDDAWSTFYMGDDGQYTMYIDAVKKEFAKSSTSDNRVSFNETSLIKYFTSYINN